MAYTRPPKEGREIVVVYIHIRYGFEKVFFNEIWTGTRGQKKALLIGNVHRNIKEAEEYADRLFSAMR